MNLSRIFIERPVATTVLVSAIIIFGLIAFRTLPVNELPSVDFPTVRVEAELRGANPEIMASTVATPLERQFSQIPGVDTMNSVSTNGRTRITLQFVLERDIDSAAQDVQTAISQAMRRMPDGVDPPTLRKVNPADFTIVFLAVSAKTLPLHELHEFAETNIAQRLSTVNGVAQVVVFGAQKYAVRVYLNPEALSTRGLGLDKVVTAIQNANSNTPSGVLHGSARNFTVKSSGKLDRASGFNNLVVAYQNGMPVRLSDIGRAEDGIENARVKSWLNGERTIGLGVYRQPGANTVEVGPPARYQEVDAEALMLTGDENIVKLEFIVQYRVRPDASGTSDFLFNIRDPGGTVRAAAEAAMREVVGRNAIDEVLTEGKAVVQVEAQRVLQQILDHYGSGIEVVTLKLQDVDPPNQVSDAFKDVISAQQDKERLINEAAGYANDVVPRARGEAAQQINQAEGYRESKVRDAAGAAQRFVALYEEYAKAKDVTRQRLYIETMEAILPRMNKIIMDDLAAKQAVPYLPLDPFLPRRAPAEVPQTGAR